MLQGGIPCLRNTGQCRLITCSTRSFLSTSGISPRSTSHTSRCSANTWTSGGVCACTADTWPRVSINQKSITECCGMASASRRLTNEVCLCSAAFELDDPVGGTHCVQVPHSSLFSDLSKYPRFYPWHPLSKECPSTDRHINRFTLDISGTSVRGQL